MTDVLPLTRYPNVRPPSGSGVEHQGRRFIAMSQPSWSIGPEPG